MHTTEKPVGLLATLLQNTPFARSIYDPFLGSGTTLVAAEQLGRRCFGLEIEEKYTDVTVLRWQAFTGSEATLLATGETFAHIAEHGRSSPHTSGTKRNRRHG